MALSFFLSYYYYYYYFRIIIHNFQCNYISPLSNFENYLKVDLKVDKYNFKVLLQLLSSMIFIHRLYYFTIYFFKCKLNYTINFKISSRIKKKKKKESYKILFEQNNDIIISNEEKRREEEIL